MALFGGLREKLQDLYAGHAQLIDYLARFLLSAGMGILIREATMWSAVLSMPLLILVSSLLLGALPFAAIPVAGAALIIGQSFALDLVAGALAAIVLLILYLLFLRFVPEDAAAAVLTPMAMYFGMDPFIPICCGLFRSPASVFAVCPGAVVCSMLRAFSEQADALRAMAAGDYAGKFTLLIRGSFRTELFVTLLSLAGTLLLVHALNRLRANYAPYLAALFGGFMHVIFLGAGHILLGTEGSIPSAVVGGTASCAAACLLLLIWQPMDYAKSEYLRFEDDDYYYYVKAIPKARGRGFAGESPAFREAEEGEGRSGIRRQR